MTLSPNEFVSSHLQKLDQYLHDVDSNTFPINKHERLAVERFNNFRNKYIYDQGSLIRVLRFYSLLNLATTTEVKQLELTGWHVFILANLYRLYQEAGRRFWSLVNCLKRKKPVEFIHRLVSKIYFVVVN
jgi:hypothetical protein